MDELEAGMVEARDVVLSHKYAKPLHVDITIQPAGEEGAAPKKHGSLAGACRAQ